MARTREALRRDGQILSQDLYMSLAGETYDKGRNLCDDANKGLFVHYYSS